MSSLSGRQVEIVFGDDRAVVVEVGGGLRSYQVRGQELLDGYGPDEMCSSGRGQVLIPWPNRLQDGSYEFDGRRLQLPLTEPTARNAIHAFNQRGMDALTPGSSRPKRVHAAFDGEGAEALRGMLHRSPREFGYESSLWTLEMAAQAAFEEGLTHRRVSGETIRATLSRELGIRWQRAKRWITSPDPLYERKKGGATD